MKFNTNRGEKDNTLQNYSRLCKRAVNAIEIINVVMQMAARTGIKSSRRNARLEAESPWKKKKEKKKT